MAHIQIKNSGATTTTYVDLIASNFTPGSLKKKVQVDPIAGQRNGSATEFVISKGDRVNVENPVHIIKGILNSNDFADTAALWNVTTITEVTLGYLYEIWRNMTGTTFIKIPFGVVDSTGAAAQFDWRDYTGTTNEIQVELDTISFIPSQDSEGRHIINYTLTLREVRA